MLKNIRAILIPYSLVEDRILWGLSQDGKFSLKSDTLAMRKPLVHHRHRILNWIWKLNLFPKIKVFLWLFLREALPTWEFLIAIKLEITNTYCLCNQSSENTWKLSQDLNIYNCCHIYRKANRTTNCLAKKGICNTDSKIWQT